MLKGQRKKKSCCVNATSYMAFLINLYFKIGTTEVIVTSYLLCCENLQQLIAKKMEQLVAFSLNCKRDMAMMTQIANFI